MSCYCNDGTKCLLYLCSPKLLYESEPVFSVLPDSYADKHFQTLFYDKLDELDIPFELVDSWFGGDYPSRVFVSYAELATFVTKAVQIMKKLIASGIDAEHAYLSAGFTLDELEVFIEFLGQGRDGAFAGYYFMYEQGDCYV